MTSFLRKCKKVIKTELSYLVLTLFSALLIAALSLSTFIVSFSMPVESISRYLEYMPSHTLLNFTYGEVSKTDVDESFYNFFDIVDLKVELLEIEVHFLDQYYSNQLHKLDKDNTFLFL